MIPCKVERRHSLEAELNIEFELEFELELKFGFGFGFGLSVRSIVHFIISR
jgi:hypothetical protein